MKKMKFTLYTALLTFVFSSVWAQKADPVQFGTSIRPDELKDHLMVIASDSLQGRETGEPGQKMAAAYIANHFEQIGLEPVVDTDTGKSYFQTFELKKQSWGTVRVNTNGREKIFLEDFYAYGDYKTEDWEEMELVFAGFGIKHNNYNDYEKLNVDGKAVVMLLDEPKDKEGNSWITGTEEVSHWNRNWELKVNTAKDKGAKVVFLVVGDDKAFAKKMAWLKKYNVFNSSLSLPQEGKHSNPFAFFIPKSMAIEMLNVDEKKFNKRIDKANKKARAAATNKFDAPISFIVERKEEKVSTENVLGFLEGTDKKDEILVITSHYDHLGVDGDKIYNGADDDGSGTVSLLEIAEAFSLAKSRGSGPRRSILFMTVTGEEKGLLGSEYYTNNPVFPLENHVTNLNVDMIGRIDPEHGEDSNYVYLIGSDRLSMDLHKISEATNDKFTQLELDYTYNDPNDPNRFYYRSDHYNFAKNNIPVIFYFTGVHDDYHQPTDTYDKIMYHKMSKIARLIFYTAWEVANTEKRPALIEGIENE